MDTTLVSPSLQEQRRFYFFALSCARKFSFSVWIELSSSIIAICVVCCDCRTLSISVRAFDSAEFASASCPSSCFRTWSVDDAASCANMRARALSVLFASVSWAQVSACSAA